MNIIKKAPSNDYRITGEWFYKILMVLSAKKYHYMCFGNRSQNDDFIFNSTKLKNGFEENILIIITDN